MQFSVSASSTIVTRDVKEKKKRSKKNRRKTQKKIQRKTPRRKLETLDNCICILLSYFFPKIKQKKIYTPKNLYNYLQSTSVHCAQIPNVNMEFDKALGAF